MSDDVIGCESCQKLVAIETAILMEECWFCADCTAEWQKTFDACQHDWTRATNSLGDESAYCRRCAGIVTLEDFPTLGFDLAAVKEAADGP